MVALHTCDGLTDGESPIDERYRQWGERLVAAAEVVKPGKTLAITRGEVYAEREGKRTLCAIMQQTLIVLAATADR